MHKICVEIAERLRRVEWSRRDVVYAVLFGSAASRKARKDVDIAVLFEKMSDLGTIDVVVLNWDVPVP